MALRGFVFTLTAITRVKKSKGDRADLKVPQTLLKKKRKRVCEVLDRLPPNCENRNRGISFLTL